LKQRDTSFNVSWNKSAPGLYKEGEQKTV
jgi:hypothetical protein